MTTDSGKKPREFWILPQKGNDCEWTNLYPDDSWKSGTKPLIHVREVGPCQNCERLEGKVQRRNEYRESLKLVIEQQKKQLEMCIEALEKYSHVKGNMAEGKQIGSGIGTTYENNPEPIAINLWAKEALTALDASEGNGRNND